MEKQIKNPVWKTVCLYVLGIVLLIFIVLMAGCGARKSAVNIQKDSEKTKEVQNNEGSVTKETKSEESNSSESKTDKVDEKQESRITELFNENGTLKSRISELLNSKSTDKSTKQEKSLKTLYIYTDSVFNNTHYITRDINHYIKDKKTDANNNSLYLSLFGLGAIGIIGFFVYKYFTRTIKVV